MNTNTDSLNNIFEGTYSAPPYYLDNRDRSAIDQFIDLRQNMFSQRLERLDAARKGRYAINHIKA